MPLKFSIFYRYNACSLIKDALDVIIKINIRFNVDQNCYYFDEMHSISRKVGATSK